MNRFSIKLSATLLAVFVSGVVCTAAETSMEGRLDFDRVKPVLLEIGAGDRDDVVKLQWIEFRREKAQVRADIRAVVLSWPKGKWQAAVSLLDSRGTVLESAEAVFENAGFIVTIPAISEGDFRLTLAAPKSTATRFRVKIAPAPEEAPVTAEMVHPSSSFRGATGSQDENADRSLDITVVGPDGRSGKFEVLLWCKAEKNYERASLSALWDVPAVWKSGRGTWRPCLSRAGDGKIENLYPGIYRATVVTGHPHGSDDPTPIGLAGTFDLEKNETGSAILQLQKGSPLSVTVVDARTGEALPKARVLLFAPDGMPIGSSGNGFYTCTDEDGVMRYANLQPGEYRLEVGPRGWWYALHPESIKVLSVKVEAGKENAVTVRYIEPVPVRDP